MIWLWRISFEKWLKINIRTFVIKIIISIVKSKPYYWYYIHKMSFSVFWPWPQSNLYKNARLQCSSTSWNIYKIFISPFCSTYCRSPPSIILVNFSSCVKLLTTFITPIVPFQLHHPKLESKLFLLIFKHFCLSWDFCTSNYCGNRLCCFF